MKTKYCDNLQTWKPNCTNHTCRIGLRHLCDEYYTLVTVTWGRADRHRWWSDRRQVQQQTQPPLLPLQQTFITSVI